LEVPAATDLQQILVETGLTLGPDDEIWADGARVVEPASPLQNAPAWLTVRRAVAVTLNLNGQTQTLNTAARTVAEALWQAGISVSRADFVQPTLDTPLTPNLTITYTTARPLTLQADGQTITVNVPAGLVSEALAAAGLPLVGLDYAVPAADQPLPVDGVIRVVRVREEILTEQTLIPRETVYQALPEVDIDTVQTVQAGADGLQRRYVRVRYEDGVEVARTVENEVLAQAAQPLVIGYGTKITLRVLDTPDGPVEYWRAYTMYATSYSASRAGTAPTARNYGLTASGKVLTKGMVAIDRNMMPFGTRMYVPGYGFAVAEDTGGGVKGRFIDLGYDDWNYQRWGKIVTVYFLTPIPPADQIRWIIPSTVP
jgi:uncharacterized protein YabE (DUF348 family)